MPGFVFSQHPTFCNSPKGYEMQKVATVKEARKRRGKGQEKVNMENATTVRKIRIFFYWVKKTLLHGELFSEIYFQSSSEFTFSV